MQEKLCDLIVRYLPGFAKEEILEFIEIPPSLEMGDFSLPCFILAKKLKKSPNIIAENIKNGIENDNETKIIAKLKVVNGYLNFYLKREIYIEIITKKACVENYGQSDIGKGKVICIDYSSPNIAKNFHVGHLRTTIIGNSLYKIYDKIGYKVIRINHLGDWGTQFGKLIVAYKKWSSSKLVENNGIEELLRIYVLFNYEAEKNPCLYDEARGWFVKMETGDEEALNIWKWFKSVSLIEFNRIYDLLGVEFDSYLGESFYKDKVSILLEKLKQLHLIEESQGANIVNLDKYNMPPCLITKKDGASIYHSRDIAAIHYRKNEYNFDKCLYVTGLEQKLHFAQIFKVIELMEKDFTGELVHVPYGLVSLEGAKLSTRSGNIIYAEDILKEAVNRAERMIDEKNDKLKNKKMTAKMIGIGAVIFHDLYNQRIKNIDFVWDNVLNFDGATGPYVQYTYVRAKSILRKMKYSTQKTDIDVSLLIDDHSYSLAKIIALYPEKILEAAKNYEPSIITRYIMKLASVFNKFYQECNIMNADLETQQARLLLVYFVQMIIKDGMQLLGIECPEEM